jgi:general secretion pathway protein F
MPTFRYRAYNSGGRTVGGEIEAAGEKDAAQRLKETGLFPIDLAEEAVGAGSLITGRVTAQDLATATRQLATLISAGTTIAEALSVLADNTSNKRLKSVILRVNESVTQGSTLARALEAHPGVFTPFYRGLVAAGEAGGSLGRVLPRLAGHLEARARVRRDVRAALAYPALMTTVGAGVLLFLLIFVIPKIAGIFEETGRSLPLATRALLLITGILGRYWILLGAGAVAGAWGLKRYSRTRGGRRLYDALVLKAPVAGDLARAFYASTLASTLGNLLGGGVQMLKALEITGAALDNVVFKEMMDAARRDCMGGAPLSASLKRHRAMPPMAAHMISVGERSGNLDEMLLKTAEAYEQEFDSGVKRAVNLLEPMLILCMGAIVGFIVLAILLPIFELNQMVK